MKSRIDNADFVINETLKGNAYQYASGPVTVTSTGPLRFLIRTNALELVLALVKITATGDDITASGYEEPTVLTEGSPVLFKQKNRQFDYNLKTDFFGGVTVSDSGQLIDTAVAYGSNQQPERTITLSDVGEGDIYVLKPNTEYLFEITSTGTSPLFIRMLACESNYTESV